MFTIFQFKFAARLTGRHVRNSPNVCCLKLLAPKSNFGVLVNENF